MSSLATNIKESNDVFRVVWHATRCLFRRQVVLADVHRSGGGVPVSLDRNIDRTGPGLSLRLLEAMAPVLGSRP
jgi:hypothetical protein